MGATCIAWPWPAPVSLSRSSKRLRRCENGTRMPGAVASRRNVIAGFFRMHRKSVFAKFKFPLVSHMEVSWNRGTPSHHPFLDGIFHEINQPFGGTPISGNPHISTIYHVFWCFLLMWCRNVQDTSNHSYLYLWHPATLTTRCQWIDLTLRSTGSSFSFFCDHHFSSAV